MATTGSKPTGGAFEVAGKPASWVRDGALDGRPIVLFAHGAGAPLVSPFMHAVAAGLEKRGSGVVRFHFPYMERNAREGRHGAPDRPPVLLATWQAILDLVCEWKHPKAPTLVLAGKSMGGRIASMRLAEGTPPGVRGSIYFGYPLTPAGKPTETRGDHLARVEVPQLFISGSRDTLCDLARLRRVLEPLGTRARLHVVEGGDHSLATSRKEPLAGSDAWLDVAAQFIAEVCR